MTQVGDPHTTRFLIDRSKHEISGIGDTFTVTGIAGIQIINGHVEF